MNATQRAYRKEAERLLLWSVLERLTPLSSLSSTDVSAYIQFMATPSQAWCGPRNSQRWSPQWRPFEGPLSEAARRQALVTLHGLFAHLVREGYLISNPATSVLQDLRSMESARRQAAGFAAPLTEVVAAAV